MAARQFGAKREARRAVRRLVDLECEVYAEMWGEPIAHRVTDISEEGLWIQTELLLEPGTEVTLAFLPPDWDEPLYVAGRVRRVELRSRPSDARSVGMGIEFQALRGEERRRLTRSMRCLRPEESYVLGQRTLTGIPVGVGEHHAAESAPGGTISGWAAPQPDPLHPARGVRPLFLGVNPSKKGSDPGAFGGGLDLAASVFAKDDRD